MKRRLLMVLPFLLVLMGVLTLSPEKSSAQCLVDCGQKFAGQSLSGSFYGGYFSSPYVQNTLSAYSHSGYYVTKETWLMMNDTKTRWMEIGTMDGDTNYGSSWSGHFTGVSDYNGYTEYHVGSQYPTGSHNFEIQYVGSNTWKAYVDYSLVHTYTSSDSYAHSIYNGIESNNDSWNTFNSGIYNSAWQYKDSGGSWHEIDSATDRDNTTWDSQLSYGRITFTHY